MNSLNCIFMITFLQLVIISYKGCFCTISCFTCSSRNGSDIDCEDPFHPGPHSYSERCKVPKRGHIGEFPAHFCIKLTGISDTTHEKLVIRRCVLGNMENQCGKFRLENDTLHGCILTCNLDGCNTSVPVSSNGALTILLLVLSSICITMFGNDSTSSLSDQFVTKKKRNSSNPPYSPSSNMHIVSSQLVTAELKHMGTESVGTPPMEFVVEPL